MVLLAVLAVLAPAAPAATVHPVEKIVVTAVASRIAEAIEATPATVSVIERVDLQRALARDLRDALRHEPGVSIENGATRFGLGNLSIRGLEGNRVVMLQDGIRLPDSYRVGSFSSASRNPFGLGLLSRIEILRGPGSALYGSDALAGVLSMATIDPRDVLRGGAPVAGFVDAGYAQADRSVAGTAAVAASSGRVQALVAAMRADGHERDNRGDVDTVGATRTTPNPQDGRTQAALAKVVVATPGGGRWRATLDGFDRHVVTDVLSLNPQSNKTVSLLADDAAKRTRSSLDGEAFALGPIDQLGWLAYRQRSSTRQDTTEERANTTAQCLSAAGTVRCRREASFRFEQVETGFTVIGESAVGAHKVAYGVEGARVETVEQRDGRQTNLVSGAVTNVVGTDIFPTRDFPNSRVDRLGAFAQASLAIGAATLIPALRFDRFEMRPEPDALYTASNPGRAVVALTDSAWSPKLGALLPVGRDLTLTFQLAAGFRAPPYSDANVGLSNLPLGYAVIANPGLEPETSRGVEAGVRGKGAGLDYAITAYRTGYRDLIVSRAPLPCPGDPRCVPGAPITFQSQNITRARIEGVEARVLARIAADWTVKAGAAWSRGEDRSRGVPLNAVEPAKLVAGLAWAPAAPSWGGELLVTHAARKSRIDASAGALRPTPSYTVADLTAFLRLGPRATVHAGLFNVFDRKHWLWSDVKGVLNAGASFDRYTQPGRQASVSVRMDF